MDSKLRVIGYTLACAGFGLAQFLATPYRDDLHFEISIGIALLVLGLATAMHGHALSDRMRRVNGRDPLSAVS